MRTSRARGMFQRATLHLQAPMQRRGLLRMQFHHRRRLLRLVSTIPSSASTASTATRGGSLSLRLCLRFVYLYSARSHLGNVLGSRFLAQLCSGVRADGAQRVLRVRRQRGYYSRRRLARGNSNSSSVVCRSGGLSDVVPGFLLSNNGQTETSRSDLAHRAYSQLLSTRPAGLLHPWDATSCHR